MAMILAILASRTHFDKQETQQETQQETPESPALTHPAHKKKPKQKKNKTDKILQSHVF